MADSSQEKLKRNQPPRVHLTYKVETEGDMPEKELPFVVGVVGDFAGNAPTEDQPALSKRSFTEVNAFNYDEVMEKMHAGLSFNVENTMSEDDSSINVNLKISKLDDFRPENVAEQIDSVRELLVVRQRLKELLLSVQGDENVKAELGRLLKQVDDTVKQGDTGAKEPKPPKKK